MVLPSSGPISLLDINSEYVANTEISGAQTALVTTLTVLNTSSFPATGSLYVRGTGEIITYTGKTATTFNGCIRGTSGSVASALADRSVVSVYRNNISLSDFYSGGTYVNIGLPVNPPTSGQVDFAGYYNGIAPKGIIAGGYSTINLNNIDYINIQILGNASSFGTLSAPKSGLSCVSSSTRGMIGGPATVIEYVTISITNTISNFVGLRASRDHASGLSNSTRGMFCGGNFIASIDTLLIASTVVATNFGTFLSGLARGNSSALASSTKGVISGGGSYSGGAGLKNTIDYITIATTGTGASFGTLSVSKTNTASVASSTRGVVAGYSDSFAVYNGMESLVIATNASMQSFGTLYAARAGGSGLASSTRGVVAGSGVSGYFSATLATMDYFTIGSTGTSATFGSLAVSKGDLGGFSNNHGGLYT